MTTSQHTLAESCLHSHTNRNEGSLQSRSEYSSWARKLLKLKEKKWNEWGIGRTWCSVILQSIHTIIIRHACIVFIVAWYHALSMKNTSSSLKYLSCILDTFDTNVYIKILLYYFIPLYQTLNLTYSISGKIYFIIFHFREHDNLLHLRALINKQLGYSNHFTEQDLTLK